MPNDRFYIGPYDTSSGVQTNYKPFVIPEEAFSVLNNAYVFRGRVRKRFGSRWLGDSQLLTRFRIAIGTTNGAGNFAGSVPLFGGVPIATPAIGQMFSIGTQVFTVVALGNPAAMLISGAATLATFDTTTGAVTINGAALATTVYYYPALPVMGLRTLEASNINDETIIGFDTRFAYQYAGGWERLATETTPGAARWTGLDSQFFWTCTWSGANASDKVFYVTNFNENEPNFMRTFFGGSWDNFRPQITATPDFLNCARILVPFKNRLVALNTWEGPGGLPGINYPNRARYSQIGSPLDVNGWRQDIPGRGNAIDCPTTEAIVSAEFVKDRLIVFFERSTWELAYTGNQAYPFVWQQINTELGAESTFSIVPFDKVALGIGDVGIHACNGTNVERIDEKIPDTVFEIHNINDGVFRVYGIRDYYVEMVYWTFPDIDATNTTPFPHRVLIYNYKTGTWAFNTDSITCFGYFQPVDGITWDSTTVNWDDDESWDGAPIQAKFRQVIGGNQEGYTFIIDPEETTNAPALQITNITVVNNIVTITAINHNLRQGEFVYLQDIIGTGNLNLLNQKIFKVINDNVNPITQNTFSFIYPDSSVVIAGTYAGNGVIARVSKIMIQTKEYNFYANRGRNALVNRVDFLVDRTDAGEVTVDTYIASSNVSVIQGGGPSGTNALQGTGALTTTPSTLTPLEATQERLWHPVFTWANGEYVQLVISMNDEQMTRVVTTSGQLTGPTFVDFQMHAMVIHARASSSHLR